MQPAVPQASVLLRAPLAREVWAVSDDVMLDATLYEELRSGDRYERGDVKRPWTAGSKPPTTSWSSSRARAAELLIQASRAETIGVMTLCCR